MQYPMHGRIVRVDSIGERAPVRDSASEFQKSGVRLQRMGRCMRGASLQTGALAVPLTEVAAR